MCFGGGGAPSPPPPVAPPAPPKEPVKYASKEVQTAGDTVQKQAALAGSTQGGTLLTGGLGDTSTAETAKKTLLGA